MAKKALLFLVLVFAFFFGGNNYVTDVWAEAGDHCSDSLPCDDGLVCEESPFGKFCIDNSDQKVEAWGPTYDQNQMEAYWNAVDQDNCATPSLECLVHQTSRFVAIEWVNNILYPGRPQRYSDGTVASSDDSSSFANKGGFVGGITHLIGEMYRYPAARTSVYVADVLENAHIITPAYAQGLGFASLNPILELWKVFRNIAYMLFVFIFIIIGFMIMFRQKIGGQSAVTAQQAIPSVIASLIFVTFSYAIAGFLIDMMYLLMFMIIGIFGQTSDKIAGGIIDFNILGLMGELNGALGLSGNALIQNTDIVDNLLSGMVSLEAETTFLGIIGGVTLSLVLAVAILIGTFKLFFELLKSYATVVLHVVTAPVILLGGAFPGKNSFGPWIKNIIANLSAFPVVLMTVILFYQFTETANTTGGFIPPFLLGRGQSGAITTLMGLAIILALPEIVKDIKTKLGATDGFGSMIFNAAGNRAKEGVPLGGRLGLGSTGGVLGGAWGTLEGGARGAMGGLKEARQQMTLGRPGVAARSLIGSTASGAFFGNKRIKKDADGKVMRDKNNKPIMEMVGGVGRGARAGATLGIRATSELSSRAAFRQPDYLNPVTNLIDKIDPKTAEKEKGRQKDEDRLDMLKEVLGK